MAYPFKRRCVIEVLFSPTLGCQMGDLTAHGNLNFFQIPLSSEERGEVYLVNPDSNLGLYAYSGEDKLRPYA